VNIDNGQFISGERKALSPLKKGFLCPKLRAAREIIYSPNRVKRPLIKDSKGIFRESSWDEALDKIALKLTALKKEHGAESVCWMQGTAADYGAPWDYVRRFMNVFGSPNAIGNGAICHVAREIAHVFTYGAMTYPDYRNTKCILIFGKNEKNTNIGSYESILYAKKNGAKLIVVDPIKTGLASKADILLRIKPGCDGLLANAMINVIISEGLYDQDFVADWTVGFDVLKTSLSKYTPEKVARRIWLEPDMIKKVARIYGTTKPACLVEGNGLDMHPNVSQNTRAVCILRAISGNLDMKGGDLFPGNTTLRNISLSEKLPAGTIPISRDYPLFNKFHKNRGDHTLPVVTDAILTEDPYPIKALIIQASNPLVTMPNSKRFLDAMKKIDLSVVIDPVMTRTARLADIVLPATTSFEKTQLNLKSMSDPILIQNQIIDCIGESRPDWKIIFDLAKKMGFRREFPWKNVEDAIDYQIEPTGITVEMLRDNPDGICIGKPRFKKYLTGGFDTRSGKIEIYSEVFREYGYPPLPVFQEIEENLLSFYNGKEQYPYVGMSGSRSRYFVHSQFRHISSLLKKDPEPFVEIHSLDSKKNGIGERDNVRIETPNGAVTMKARISEVVPPGLIRLAWGWGEVDPSWNLNQITDDTIRDPLTCTPSSRSFMCRIKRVD
jgi:anaerobic selenocysteine-containing dehydrogenase